MLEKIKLVLNIDENDITFDRILILMIEDTTTAILNYCNITKLPKQLEYVVREIVVTKFKSENGDYNIQSIKRGDTQITYTNTIDINSFNTKHINALNRFRKIIVG